MNDQINLTAATQPIIKSRNTCTWAEEDHPHYKLLENGKHSLTESELLSMIIGGSPDKAMPIAMEILQKMGNDLDAVFQASSKDLSGMGIKGLTERVCRLIVAVGELGRRRQLAMTRQVKKITSSRDAFNILYPRIGDMPVEQFMVITLNRANKVLQTHTISLGGLTGTIADPRIILRHCLQDMATGLILSHNHPSGNKIPSQCDVDLTKKVKEAAKFLDISVLDHIIIAGKDYFSFADDGMI